jgi:hypothetical protein
LGIGIHASIRKLVEESGFPHPRIGKMSSKSLMRRWRVGDVRAWISQSSRLDDELKTEFTCSTHPWNKQSLRNWQQWRSKKQ